MERCRILVIYDSPFVLKVIEALLASSDRIEVLGLAFTGHTALDQIPSIQPDLILTDLVMAGMSGLEVIRRVMQQSHRLPVILMTADGSPGCRLAAERAGAAGFLEKADLRTHLIPLIGRLVPGCGEARGDRATV